jgi:hypothetical protein
MNCFDLISFDKGQSLFPEPPDRRMMFIAFLLIINERSPRDAQGNPPGY